MHIGYASPIRITDMHIGSAYWICISDMHVGHAYRICMAGMHIGCGAIGPRKARQVFVENKNFFSNVVMLVEDEAV